MGSKSNWQTIRVEYGHLRPFGKLLFWRRQRRAFKNQLKLCPRGDCNKVT